MFGPNIVTDILVMLSLTLIILGVALVFIFKPTRVNQKAIWFIAPVFVAGFIINYIGISNIASGGLFYDLTFALFMAFKMFTFNLQGNIILQLGEIAEFYKIVLIIGYLCASLYSLFVVTIFLIGNLNNYFSKLIIKNKASFYIIFGDGENALSIADSIDRNCLVYLTNNEENRERLKKYAQGISFKKGYFLLKNINNVIKEFKDCSKNITYINFFESSEANYQNNMIISKTMNSNSKAYIYYDNSVFSNLIQIKNSFVDKHIVFFSDSELIVNNLLNKHHFLNDLPKEYINTEVANLNTNKKINFIFLGSSSIHLSLLDNLSLQFLALSKQFTSDVFGPKASELKEKFFWQHNNLKDYLLLSKENNKEYYELTDYTININAYDNDIYSQEFLDNFKKALGDFTYIFIDMENDKETQELTIKLKEVLLSKKEDDEYRIFAHLRKSATIINKDDKNILIYGESEEVLSKSFIIDEAIDTMAKGVNFYYESKYGNPVNKEDAWSKISVFNKESNRSAAYGIITKLNLMGFDLVSTQGSKPISKEEYFKSYFKNDNQTSEDYSKFNNCRLNLGIIEHRRWELFQIYNNRLPMKKEEILAGNKYNKLDTRATKHANIMSFNALEVLEKEMKNKMEEGYDIKESQTKIIIKDFDLMDNLFNVIAKTDYYLIKKNKN